MTLEVRESGGGVPEHLPWVYEERGWDMLGAAELQNVGNLYLAQVL